MSRSFGLDTARDALDELAEEVVRFEKDDLNTSLARSIALSAWQLCDHVWKEAGPRLGFKQLKNLQAHARLQCVELAYMRDVCTQRKHGEIRKHRTIDQARLHGGAFSRGFSEAFDIDRLEIVLLDGRRIPFKQSARSVVKFWSDFFAKNGIA